MRRPLTLAASALLAAVPAVAQEMSVPSGQMVTLQEVLLDDAPGELWVRFRFLAPEITRDGGSVASYAADRLGGSVAAAIAAAEGGARVLRVHDVAETAQALKVWRAIKDRKT